MTSEKLPTDGETGEAAPEDRSISPASAVARGEVIPAKPGGRTQVAFATRDGRTVRQTADVIPDLEDVLPSGLWPHLPQVEVEQIFDEPIILCDGAKLTSDPQMGPYYIGMIRWPGIQNDSEAYFTTALGGKAVVEKIDKLMAQNRLPVHCKIVVRTAQVTGREYYDLVGANWTPESEAKT